MTKTAVSAALFGEKYRYYLDLSHATLASLNGQTDTGFDVVVFTEPHMEAELKNVFMQHAPGIVDQNRLIICTLVSVSHRPVDNLVAAHQRIEYLSSRSDQYKWAMMVDLDDIYPPNYHVRMKKVMGETGATIVGADQWAFDEKTENGHEIRLISPRHGNRVLVTYQDIQDKNRFGFCNTLFDLQKAGTTNHQEMAYLPTTLNPAPDWYYFTRLIAQGHQAVYTNEAHILYRQHDSNLVGNNKNSLAKVLELKRDFYRHVFADGGFSSDLIVEADRLSRIFDGWMQVISEGGKESSLFQAYKKICDAKMAELWAQGKPPEWWEMAVPVAPAGLQNKAAVPGIVKA